MSEGFDKEFWEQHWQEGRDGGPGSMSSKPPNPYLAVETAGLEPGSALDAGCGAGAEALWLAANGWQVTAVDISATALARAGDRAAASGLADSVQWVEADLDLWAPGATYDLVTTHYAHSARPQLELYDRLASWVAPGGTLLIVGHLHTHGTDVRSQHGHGHGHGHDDGPPEEASVTAAAVAARLDADTWDVVTVGEHHRTMPSPGGRDVPLDDVVVRAIQRR